MYHAIVIDQEFSDLQPIANFEVFAQKNDGAWKIMGIVLPDKDLETSIKVIQNNLKNNQPWYVHLYNDDELIVVFKEKVIKAKPHASTWGPIIKYGTSLNLSLIHI